MKKTTKRIGEEEIEAALRCWGEYQRVKADCCCPGRRRRSTWAADGWTSERLGFVCAVAFRVERALAGMDDEWREAIRHCFAEGLAVDSARMLCGSTLSREQFRLEFRRTLLVIGEKL